MNFVQVRKAITNGEHMYAYLKFKRTTVRVSKTPKPIIRKCKYALENGLLWEINQKKNNLPTDWDGWEEIRECAQYKCSSDWQFVM